MHDLTVSKKQNRILVTAFEPFLGETVNPSLEVLKNLAQLKKSDMNSDMNIDTLVLPVAFERVFERVRDQLFLHEYDFVLLLGQAGGRKNICLERVALNLIDTTVADEDGQWWLDRKIQEDGPEAYLSPLPLRQWLDILLEKKYSVEISNTAGLFVCNYLYFQVLHYLKANHQKTRCLFVHLPFMPEQVSGKSDVVRALPLQEMQEGVLEIINQCKAL